MKPIKPLYVVIIVIVFAAAGFYGGTLYQKNQIQASFANGAGGPGGQFVGRFGGGGRGNFAGGARPVSGQIVSQDSNSITVKSPDGSSKIINLTSQTTISKTTTGSASDLTSGQHVTAIGTTNSDGSVIATNILVGNGMMMFRGQRGGQPSPTSTQ